MPEGLATVSTKSGLDYAKKCGAKGYVECSAKFDIGVVEGMSPSLPFPLYF